MSNIEENIMSEEAFNELIDNFEVVETLTDYGRKAIKQNVKKLKTRIQELEEENRMQRKQIMSAYNRGWIPKQKVKDIVKEAIEIIESEQFKIIMGDMTKVGRLRWLLEKELLEDK